MANGLSVALPLRIDSIDGAYGLHKDFEDLAQQNLKMLILTSPGERIMVPEFGVGIRSYLFEQNTPTTLLTIKENIAQQAKKYMPYIEIIELEVYSPAVEGSALGDTNKARVNIRIVFSVPAVNVISDLTIPVEV